MTTAEVLRLAGEPGGRGTVVLVDDETAILRICEQYLEPVECDVIACSSGEKALEVVTARPVDVVVSDHAMPGMTGIELLERVMEVSPGTVRVLYTGVLDTRIAENALNRAEVFRFLVKPFDAKALRNVVTQAMAYRRMAEENRCFREEMETLVQAQSREIAEANAFLESLLDTLPAGVLSVDLEGRITRANRAALRALGHDLGDLIGRQVHELGVPCRPEECVASAGGGPTYHNHEVEVTNRWGLRRVLLWSCEQVWTKDGQRAGCASSFIYVSEKRELETAVFNAKQEIEAVFDSITDPTVVVDAEGRVMRANRAFSHLVRKPFQDVLGQGLPDLLGPVGVGPVPGLVRDLFAEATPAQAEHRSPSGTVYTVRAFPMFKRGRVEAAVIRYQDVTAERELKYRLIQSEKMASVGQLAAGIAHEINNPVGFISSNLNRLAEYSEELQRVCRRWTEIAEEVAAGRMPPGEAWETFRQARMQADLEYVLGDIQDIVAECREGTERIRNIVTDLKTFSHPGDGDFQYTDINASLESTLNIARNELKYHCEVVRDFGELPAVLCRPQRLNQVFLNLIVNAAQAIPKSGTVTVRTRAEGDRVTVEVTDTGTGIPEEKLLRIFDPFFTTKPAGEGTGLGLHLAATIVRDHGGEIQVESRVGEGSTFRVVLPVVPPGAPEGQK